MELRFKHQKFQEEAAKAVVDVFAEQPYSTPFYMMDTGSGYLQPTLDEKKEFTGWSNQKIVPELNDSVILENLNKVQKANGLKPSEKLDGHYNLTIEMETGVGKTYTYIKTMYELNRAYGWSKFIIVVPSIAIREGVYKSFEMTKDHFTEEYGKQIRFFIYNSAQLTEIDRFASDSSINAMIINAQAFNAKGKDARRITMKLDEFRSRRPIDILAQTNPILIIDEPQSVEGPQTKENLKKFKPLLTLRYSATHKSNSIYNMVYRLDAMDAYNQHLVKKIAVKGISESGTTATDGFVYLESVNLSKDAPTATIQFEVKGAKDIRRVTRVVKERDNLYDQSKELEEYKNNFVVSRIDGRDSSVEFLNGLKLYAGDVIGKVNEDQLRRIQIRETILSHIERERELFRKGIKVLSLFFIDEVAKYRLYDEAGQPKNGIYAQMFEEEYKDVLENYQFGFDEDDYMAYLKSIPAERTHAGYFSIDKKGKMIDSKVNRKDKERTTDDVDAYDLIMKNKELLLDRDPKRSPVRFIFSHSALREGWDNPNVFQICTLKQSSSEVRKRQEVGRGLRLCVNQDGERMDENVLGNDVHNVNVLTVIASESYDSFAKGLQTELAEAVGDRPIAVTTELFEGKELRNANGDIQVVDKSTAMAIHFGLIWNGYIDKKGALTDKYYDDKKNGQVVVADEVKGYEDSVLKILDSVYDGNAIKIENVRSNNVQLHVNEDKLAMKEFKALWSKINRKTVYTVDFDTEELITQAIQKLDKELRVSKIHFVIESGVMEKIGSKDELLSGGSFSKEVREDRPDYNRSMSAKPGVPYDLIGKIVEKTTLTRKAVVRILRGIKPEVFNQFKNNPEEFILKASDLINEVKATVIIQHISYDLTTESYKTDIFTEPTIKGRLDVNAMKAEKHLYDYIVYDSENEKKFAEDLELKDNNVAVYVKLPSGFYISTPVGKYNPDWAIAFYEGTVKHIYFVAETKGDMSSMQLRMVEEAKAECAAKHFEAISGDEVVYKVIHNYNDLLTEVMK